MRGVVAVDFKKCRFSDNKMNAQPPQNNRGMLTAMSSTFLLADAASVAVVEEPPAVAATLLGSGGPPTVGAIVAIAMLVRGLRGPKYLHQLRTHAPPSTADSVDSIIGVQDVKCQLSLSTATRAL